MSYPTQRQATTSTQPSLTSPTNTYLFTQACAAGNLIAIYLAGDKNTGTLSVTDNIGNNGGANPWHLEVAVPGTNVSLYIAWKVAVGGETTITATTGANSNTGNTGYGEELVDDGAGPWLVLAKASPAYNDASRTSAASGTTDVAEHDGRAVAVGVIDSMSALGNEAARTSPTFSDSYTKPGGYNPAWPAGSGGGSAGCYVAVKDIPAGQSTSTTFTLNAGTGDQIGVAVAVFGREELADPPGAVFDLSRWKLTLPTGASGADEVEQPELATYTDAGFYLDAQNRMVMIAPVVGATTGGSSSTRREFREMGNTDWNAATTGFRQLTVTGIWDPTSITGGTTPRKEMIVGQIHGPSGTPPLYLAVEHHVASPRLRVYKDGPGLSNVLTGLTATTKITYRIRIDSARIQLWAAIGEVADLPTTPQHDWAVSEFTEDTTVCYLKAGPYNKTTVASGSSGAAIGTITHLELIQPGPTGPEPGRFLLAA
jgi:hypothetical protein